MADERRATIAAIARAANVSPATVSKVWNGRPDVSAATRARVEGLLRDHDYRARAARLPASAGVVDVVFPEIDCAWEGEHIRGIEAAVRDAGVRTVVSSLQRGAASGRQLVQRLRAGRTDGVILAAGAAAGPLAASLRRLRVPVVALEPARRAPSDLPMVDAANWAGARAATRHLLELGHRRIAVITGTDELLCSRARLEGYLAAHDEFGVAPGPGLAEQGDFDFPSGLAAGSRLLDRPDPPTAVFACSDHMAMGVYEAARRRRVSVPGQLSVVGFDDLPGARWASPPLTTVRQPLREMGRLAAEAILSLAGGATARERSTVHTDLVIRASTAPR
ncbi:LacI family transcriptional regulator [Actinoplanes lobatus]|uniref:LacI family transcriptional regulator n=1 Tax=Actinoplanes lobatus TaxID=113568 RepID=A0A7W7HNU9_9ACTN|nr:LacI family DNA-binding transcriptional regulator [Actinoplanes lobatus]MBB4753955.1 LacI family transcriptional regulator [Actinoplanes lobatus]GGN93054.1 LacI family transcriptional regulator [Actinoplanes lobatus]GIE44005.1 LacI family transcriptional regulator [Actinoplanes lobatus]